MKILLVHNKYKHAGGEDFVFQSESDLLRQHGHLIDHLVFNNALIKTVLDKVNSGLRLIYNPTSARVLAKRITEFEPDIIHIHNFVPLASPSILFVAKKFNIPVVLTLHNYRLLCPSATLFHCGKIYENNVRSVFPIDAILKGVYRNSRIQTMAVALMIAFHNIVGTWRKKVDLYIALTHFAKEKFLESSLSIPENKILVKANSVTDYGPGETVRKDFFLFVGRLVEEKGILTLLNATKLQDFKLIIIGEGPLEKQVIEFTKSNSNIKYLGYQDKATVINYMKNCKALIFPSIWYEGLPITILEAFATGTVVIASNIGSMAEIIEDKINGLHFDAGNEADLAKRIIEVLNHQVNVHKISVISVIARLSYLENYTADVNYSALIHAYRMATTLCERNRVQPVKGKSMPQFEHA